MKKKKEVFVKHNKVSDIRRTLIMDLSVSILRSRTSEGDLIIREFEEKHGSSMNAAKKEFEELSRKQQKIHQQNLSLEEYSKLIRQIRAKFKKPTTSTPPKLRNTIKSNRNTKFTLNFTIRSVISVANIHNNYNKIKEVHLIGHQFRDCQKEILSIQHAAETR